MAGIRTDMAMAGLRTKMRLIGQDIAKATGKACARAVRIIAPEGDSTIGFEIESMIIGATDTAIPGSVANSGKVRRTDTETAIAKPIVDIAKTVGSGDHS